jgi:hypothetical protein
MKHSIKTIILMIFMTVTSVADFVLTVGDLEIEILATKSYTVGNMFYNGRLVCGDWSAQGTVLQIDDTWCGSGHQNEQVLELQLKVNENPVSIEDEKTYSRVEIEFYRRTSIGDAYILNSKINSQTIK